MVLISEKIASIVEHAHNELSSALKEMAAFVETVERTPGPVESRSAITMTELSTLCQRLTTDLNKYTLFFEEIHGVVSTADDAVENLADRFKKRSFEPGIPINSAQAMELFSRSRSTIYRWIKSGKLKAEKRGRRWVIFI